MFTNAFVTKSCEKNKMTLLEQGYLTRMNFNKQANKSNNKIMEALRTLRLQM